MREILFFLLIQFVSVVHGSTVVHFSMPPVNGSTVTCNGKFLGSTPFRIAMNAGEYVCSMKKLNASFKEVKFNLSVLADDSEVSVTQIGEYGSGVSDIKPSISRKKVIGPLPPPPEDFSTEAERLIQQQNGPVIEKLIRALVNMKSASSDSGAFVSRSEFAELKRMSQEHP